MSATDQLSAEAGLFTYYNHKTSVPRVKVKAPPCLFSFTLMLLSVYDQAFTISMAFSARPFLTLYWLD